MSRHELPYKQLEVTSQFVLEAINTKVDLPDDLEMVHVKYDHTRGIMTFLVRSEEFEELPEAQEPPVWTPEFKQGAQVD